MSESVKQLTLVTWKIPNNVSQILDRMLEEYYNFIYVTVYRNNYQQRLSIFINVECAVTCVRQLIEFICKFH